MKTWEENAKTGPHLELLSSVAVEGSGSFVLRGGHVYLGARYGSSHVMNVIDVRDPAAAKVTTTLKFKGSIAAVAMMDELLIAAESGRALHLFELKDPARPTVLDVGVALGKSIYDVARLGRYAVAALNWEGVGLMDLENPRKARWVSELKLEDGFVEHLVVAGGHIFATGASDGLVVMDVVDGKLAQLAKPAGKAFNASEVFRMGDRVWVFGSNDDDKAEILVIDPAQPTKIEHRFTTKVSLPKCLLPVKDGSGIGFFTHYSCAQYDPAQRRAGMIFRQYTRDKGGDYIETPADTSSLTEAQQEELQSGPTTCMETISHLARRGPFLYAAQGEALTIYRIREGSAFAETLDPSGAEG